MDALAHPRQLLRACLAHQRALGSGLTPPAPELVASLRGLGIEPDTFSEVRPRALVQMIRGAVIDGAKASFGAASSFTFESVDDWVNGDLLPDGPRARFQELEARTKDDPDYLQDLTVLARTVHGTLFYALTATRQQRPDGTQPVELHLVDAAGRVIARGTAEGRCDASGSFATSGDWTWAGA